MHPTNPTLLYLDNDAMQCEEVAEVLRACGLRVTKCHHVHCVNRHIEKTGLPDAFLFDLAVSDVMNGFELAESLVLAKGVSPSRFYFLSAWTSDFTRPNLFREEQVFQKPLRGDRFTLLVEQIRQCASPEME